MVRPRQGVSSYKPTPRSQSCLRPDYQALNKSSITQPPSQASLCRGPRPHLSHSLVRRCPSAGNTKTPRALTSYQVHPLGYRRHCLATPALLLILSRRWPNLCPRQPRSTFHIPTTGLAAIGHTDRFPLESRRRSRPSKGQDMCLPPLYRNGWRQPLGPRCENKRG